MLLQLPVELQQQVLHCLTTEQALDFRAVSRECRDLASSCIRTCRLSSVGDLKQMAKSFPNVSDLALNPETAEDVLMLFDSFLPDHTCSFPPSLQRLSIDTSRISYDVIHAFQVADKVQTCADLQSVELAGYCINLTADNDFLQKLISIQAIAETDPHYPAACFLSSGIIGLQGLTRGMASCTNLRVLKTYTRSCQDTQDLMRALHECPGLETLELRVPFVQAVQSLRPPAPCPQVRRLKLIQRSNGGTFDFDLTGFPAVEFLVISLPSVVPESLFSQPMQNLKTAWLHNVTSLSPLEHAPKLVTLSLNYSDCFGSHFFEPLHRVPQLRRLEICDHNVDVDDLLACPHLQELVLVDAIGKSHDNQTSR